MDNDKIARELIKVARELLGSEQEFARELKKGIGRMVQEDAEVRKVGDTSRFVIIWDNVLEYGDLDEILSEMEEDGDVDFVKIAKSALRGFRTKVTVDEGRGIAKVYKIDDEGIHYELSI